MHGKIDLNPSGPGVPPRSARRPRRSARIDVLYEDADLVAANVPPGLAEEPGWMQPASGGEPHSGAGDASPPTPVSLWPTDAEISGLMVWTRNDAARQRLGEQFADRRLSCVYLAVVRATVLDDSGVIDRPILDPGETSLRVRLDARRGRPAMTEWRLRDRFVSFALLECTPRTRVRHQVRAHLEAAGLPLAVDPRYGGAESLMLSSFKAGYRRSRRRPERPLIRRPTLHAWRISFEQPMSGRPLQFEVAPPKDLRATLHQLDRFGRIPKAGAP